MSGFRRFSKSPSSLTAGFLFAVVMTYLLIRALAATGATMCISSTTCATPDTPQSVTVNQVFTATVRISTDNSSPVTGASVYLTYPTDKLQLIGEDYSNDPYGLELVTNNSNGVLRMDRAALPMIPGGDQLFARINFKAVATGSADISFGDSSVVTSGVDNSNILSQRTSTTYTITAPTTTGGGPGDSGGSGSTATGSGGGVATGQGSPTPAPAPSSSPDDTSTTPSSPSTPTPNANPSPATPTPSTSQAATVADQTASIQITVIDSQNQAVVGATVTVGNQTVKTDKNGVAAFSGVPVGQQPVLIKYNGKQTTKTIQVNQASQTPQLLKVSIVRDKYNPVILLLPLLVFLLAAVTIILRPWNRWTPAKVPVTSATAVAPIVSSVAPPPATPRPGYKVAAPGTVYAPSPNELAKDKNRPV